MNHARPTPALYARSQSPEQRQVNATYGRELLRVLGGIPDPPEKLEAARVDLLLALTEAACRRARGARDVAVALELRGRRSEAAVIRRYAGVRFGRQTIAAECHLAAQMGPAGILRARALGWALRRL